MNDFNRKKFLKSIWNDLVPENCNNLRYKHQSCLYSNNYGVYVNPKKKDVFTLNDDDMVKIVKHHDMNVTDMCGELFVETELGQAHEMVHVDVGIAALAAATWEAPRDPNAA